MKTHLIKSMTNHTNTVLFACILIMSMLIPTQQILADERAKKGKCYIATGYVQDKRLAAAAAKELFINYDDFELFERSDKKVYLTIGKTDQKLFNQLKANKKTYGWNCSSGKGYLKRYSFDRNFNLVSGLKKFIDSESDYFSVIAPIEAEEKRLVDLEIQKQVEEQMRLAAIKKQEEEAAAEKERLRLLEIARNKQAEIDRLAALEKAKQAEIDRIAAQEKAKQAEIDRLAAQEKAKQAEIERLAAQEKAKEAEIKRLAEMEQLAAQLAAQQAEIERLNVPVSNDSSFCIGFLGRLESLLEQAAENDSSVKLVVDDMAKVNMTLTLRKALKGAKADEIKSKEGFEFANKYMETNAVQEVMDSKSVSNRQIDSCVKLL